MKIKKGMLMLIVLLLLSIPITASAGSTTKNLVTNFTLVNTSSSDATGTIEYYTDYSSGGSSWTGSSVTEFGPGKLYQLPASGQLVVRQYADTLTAGRGSVVIVSDVALASVVQERLAPGDTNPPTSGAYLGIQEGSSKYYVPLVQVRANTSTGLANTQIMVQNLSAVDIDVDINLIASPSCSSCTPQNYTKSVTSLKPGVTYFYDLADEHALSNGWNGSAFIDAGSNTIGVVVNSFNGEHGLRTFNAFRSTDVGPKWGIPLLASKLSNGLNTSIAIQNLSSGTIPVDGITLDCTDFEMTNNIAIPQYGSFSFNPLVDSPENFPDNWQGACSVDAGENDIVAFVIMRRVGGINGDQAAYEAINYNTIASKVIVPLAAKRLPNGFATSIVVQNLSNSDIIVDALWRVSPTECGAAPANCIDYDQNNLVIPANGNITFNLRMADGGFPNMADGWQGSLQIVPNAGSAPIAGYTVLSNLVNTPGDNYRAHDLLIVAP